MPGSPNLEKIVQKWHDLAEQRLAYYTELYRSGRWKHYYTQESFAARMLDVIEAAKKWQQLAARMQDLPQPETVQPVHVQVAALAQAYPQQWPTVEPKVRAAQVRSAA